MDRLTRVVAWLTTAWLMGVVVFGAWVRISHSGAGCGEDWPHCQGALFPDDPVANTLIEYTHRITSALGGLLVIGTLILVWRRFGARSSAGKGAALTLLLILIEGAMGAALVKFRLVLDNDTLYRAAVMGVHALNTQILVGAAAVTAWLTGLPGGQRPAGARLTRQGGLAALLFLITAATGAVAALAHTLFPASGSVQVSPLTAARMAASASRPVYEAMASAHPWVAATSTVFLVLIVLGATRGRTLPEGGPQARALVLVALVGAAAVGLLNLLLGTPTWTQLLHFFVVELGFAGLAVLFLGLPGSAAPSSAREITP